MNHDMKYLLAIDQSTAGTKALIFDQNAKIIGREDLPHEQKISKDGWVSHDPMEIYRNTISVVKKVVNNTGVDKDCILGVGISNQRETALVWDRETGHPLCDAVVWQCSRGANICQGLQEHTELIAQKTGLPLSPYFSASKIAWILQSTSPSSAVKLCAGTMDSWLVYKLTNGKSFKTDYSNASRTQLFNIIDLRWDEEVCKLFGIPSEILPELCDSDGFFGETDFEGFLDKPIPVHGVLGDSHGALFGQGCLNAGMTKATYGTGSSVMMNIGNIPVFSHSGVATSLAWCMGGKVQYVLEGNINYSGAVIKWLVEDLELLNSAKEAGIIAPKANREDETYLVPAFTGLGAPHWDSNAKAMIYGMTRGTKKAEIVKAAEESIAYQIMDVINAMSEDSGIPIREIRADGGATRDNFLMQFQSDILDITVAVPQYEEISAIGAAYVAGLALGIYDKTIFDHHDWKNFQPGMAVSERERKYSGWKKAVEMVKKN